jgi:hypothetical protein
MTEGPAQGEGFVVDARAFFDGTVRLGRGRVRFRAAIKDWAERALIRGAPIYEHVPLTAHLSKFAKSSLGRDPRRPALP